MLFQRWDSPQPVKEGSIGWREREAAFGHLLSENLYRECSNSRIW